jgi:formylglycine-generating enzyme required for sulfatase activity
VAKEFQQDIDTIIELTIDKPAIEIKPIAPIVSAEKQTQRKELNLQNEAEVLKAQKFAKEPTPVDQIILDDKENIAIVPAGKFPFRVKEVFVDTFGVQKYEVTNYQYCQFLNSCKNPDSHRHSSKIQKVQLSGKTLYKTKSGFENYPVVVVAYKDACAYADWKSKTTGLKYSVPAEAQWEKAAAWDPVKKYYYNYAIQSDEIRTDKFACSSSILFNRDVEGFYAPIAVGSYNAKSYYGCYDMSGNVQEWTSGMIDDKMILKGGSYWNYHTSCRCFSRCPMNASYAGGDRGFRLVVDFD